MPQDHFPPAPSPRQALQMPAGQSQMQYWPAGTLVRPLSGAVWLTDTPRWLGEHLLRPRLRIEAHAVHRLADSGWVKLWAETDVVIQILPGETPEPGWSQLAHSMLALANAVWRRLRPLHRLATNQDAP